MTYTKLSISTYFAGTESEAEQTCAEHATENLDYEVTQCVMKLGSVIKATSYDAGVLLAFAASIYDETIDNLKYLLRIEL